MKNLSTTTATTMKNIKIEPVKINYLSIIMIDHNVVRFNVSMHYTHAMAIVKSLEKKEERNVSLKTIN